MFSRKTIWRWVDICCAAAIVWWQIEEEQDIVVDGTGDRAEDWNDFVQELTGFDLGDLGAPEELLTTSSLLGLYGDMWALLRHGSPQDHHHDITIIADISFGNSTIIIFIRWLIREIIVSQIDFVRVHQSRCLDICRDNFFIFIEIEFEIGYFLGI